MSSRVQDIDQHPSLTKDFHPAESDYDNKKAFSDASKSETNSLYDLSTVAALAPADQKAPTAGGWILQKLGLRSKDRLTDLDAIATRESVFDGPLGTLYRDQIHPKWENAASFDPSFRWTYREEAAVIRKVDWKIFAWILVMFLALDIDRGNLANATADNLLKDLKITQADYNLGNTLSKLGFLTAELPSQMVGKKIGVDIWLPLQLVIFSALAAGQFAMKGRTSFLALRFLIAFFQGGFIPDCILYCSYYYTKYDLPIRLSFFWSINYLSDMITAFLAVGLLKLRGTLGYTGWQWMFLLEGIFTLVIGLASFFMLPASPSQTKSRWRPKGYFTDDEVKLIVNRVIRDDHTKTSMHNRQALTPKLLWKSLCDYDLWPMYLIALTFGIPGYPLKNYFQLSMKKLGFSTVKANLLSVPNTAISIVNLLLITLLSEVVNSRSWVASLEQWWFLPFFIALRVIRHPTPWVYFTLATLVLGFPYAHALQVAWCSRNSGSVRTRTVSASVYNMFVQASAIIGANLYQATDSPPYYPKANSAIIGVIVFNLVVVYPGTYFYYKQRNAYKEKKWSALSSQEQAEYVNTTTDEGAKRLDFRFAY